MNNELNKIYEEYQQQVTECSDDIYEQYQRFEKVLLATTEYRNLLNEQQQLQKQLKNAIEMKKPNLVAEIEQQLMKCEQTIFRIPEYRQLHICLEQMKMEKKLIEMKLKTLKGVTDERI